MLPNTLFVLREFRFSEGLAECDRMEKILTVESSDARELSTSTSKTMGENRGVGKIVAPSSAGLALSLSQEYFCGFSLPMPVPSLLSSNAIELQSSSRGDNTSDLFSVDMDFDKLLCEAGTSSFGKEDGLVRTEEDVHPDRWHRMIAKHRARFLYLQKKYGCV